MECQNLLVFCWSSLRPLSETSFSTQMAKVEPKPTELACSCSSTAFSLFLLQLSGSVSEKGHSKYRLYTINGQMATWYEYHTLA